MKRFLLITASVLLLAGCGSNNDSLTQIENKKPRIPQYEFKASILDHDYSKYDIEDMEKLLEEIDKDLTRPNITEEDIRRGWYLGDYGDRKYGTPDSWIWEDADNESRWVSPNALEEVDYFEVKQLCSSTAGTYVISCIDTEIVECEYVPETECKCVDGTKWVNKQGCILLGEESEEESFISISQDELKRGWYQGLPSEKKLNTPSSWIWIEGGQDSRWQNPGTNN
ncbi:hypothetical protein KKA95_03520 [Patescibacteria group bacterium]|nr:hypothetical protein [Patescibacteria group bacterium]